MEKVSYNDKLRMQTLREQGLGEKAIIVSYPDKPMSSVKKVRSQVDRTQPLCVNQAVRDLPQRLHAQFSLLL